MLFGPKSVTRHLVLPWVLLDKPQGHPNSHQANMNSPPSLVYGKLYNIQYANS